MSDSSDERLPRGVWSKTVDRLRANDAVWLSYHLMGKAAAAASGYLMGRAGARERARDLPGVNSREYNRIKWNGYDWSERGEEWSPSPQWRQSVVDELIVPWMPEHADTLEVGPGGGRWSVELQRRARRLTLADISETAIELCRDLLREHDNVAYVLTDGQTLTGIADHSVDFLWSFDVFVHIAPVDQKQYLAEIARVMRPGARAVIHHAGEGGAAEGWRSSMTAALFAGLLRDNGLRPLDQFDRWGDNGQFTPTEPGDVITVFEQPQDPSGERVATPAAATRPTRPAQSAQPARRAASSRTR